MAGMTLRWARSPVAPNRTNAHGSGTRSRRKPARSGFMSASTLRRRRDAPSVLSWRAVRAGSGGAGTRGGLIGFRPVRPQGRWDAASSCLFGLHGVAAELVAKCRQNLGLVAVVLARPEPVEQGQGDYRRRHVLVDRFLDGP